MKNITVVANDRAAADELRAAFAQSPEVGESRAQRPDEVTEASGHDFFVLLPDEVRGLPDIAAAAELSARVRSAAQVVLISSAAVNEPSAHYPGLLSEDRLLPLRRNNEVAASWRELEARVRKALANAPAALSILRAPALIFRDGRSSWSRFFRGRAAATVLGFDPTIQLLEPSDLVGACLRAVEKGQAGDVWNVAPSEPIPLHRALKAARVWRLPLPAWLHRIVRQICARPTGYVDYLRYSWTVSDEKIRRLGSKPAATSAAAIRAPSLSGFDSYGLDKAYVARLGKTLFRFLHDLWWRVEWRGLEHVPVEGRAVLTGVHRGHQPWDGVMTLHLLARELGRHPRFLVHPTLIKFPFLTPYMVKCGGVLACQENADRVLEQDGIVGIFPEGIRGAFRRYEGDQTYRLGRFGRHDFVRMALRHQAPIVPYVTVGSAEIFPILGRIDWSWLKRYTEWPYFPITPTMGTVPLPSKWHTRFLEPIHVEESYPPEAADDLALVRKLSQEVRTTMQAALDDMLRRRRSLWHGSIFAEDPPAALERETA